MRWFPLLGLALLTTVSIGFRVALQWARYRETGFALFRSGRPAQHLRDALLVSTSGLLLGQSLAAALAPGWLAWMRWAEPWPLAGAALMALATALLAVAQIQMGRSWRIGIDPSARLGLVTRGFFRFTRNPIYLFLMVALVGYLLLVPTWLSALTVVGVAVAVKRQVAEEERYLVDKYGDEFLTWARRVGRFVPGLGRLE